MLFCIVLYIVPCITISLHCSFSIIEGEAKILHRDGSQAQVKESLFPINKKNRYRTNIFEAMPWNQYLWSYDVELMSLKLYHDTHAFDKATVIDVR